MQKNIVTVPRAAHRWKLRENMYTFDFWLDDDEMATIDSMEGEEGAREYR